MSVIEGWYQVGPDGHMPYVAAELPPGYWVHLSEAGAIGAIQEQMPEELGGPAPAGAAVPSSEVAALEAEASALQVEINRVAQQEQPQVNGG